MNIREEFRRPLSLGLASVALIGWILTISVWALFTSRLQKTKSQLTNSQVQVERLGRDLQTERAAAGTLSELEGKLAADKELLLATNQSRDRAALDLMRLQRQSGEFELQIRVDRAGVEQSARALAASRSREEAAKVVTAGAEAALATTQARSRQTLSDLLIANSALKRTQEEEAARHKAADDLDRELGVKKTQRDTLAGEATASEQRLEKLRGELTALTEQLQKARATRDDENARNASDARKPLASPSAPTLPQRESGGTPPSDAPNAAPGGAKPAAPTTSDLKPSSDKPPADKPPADKPPADTPSSGTSSTKPSQKPASELTDTLKPSQK